MITDYLRSVISLTYSRIVLPHRIHELKNIPFLHGNFMRKPPDNLIIYFIVWRSKRRSRNIPRCTGLLLYTVLMYYC
jgi:hypothetical protein